MSTSLLDLDPVPALMRRVRAELAADFPASRPVRVSRAPGRLDVMGGIADYTGSLVCEMPLDRAAAVALAPRDDRVLQVFSFNLYDEHKPFTFRIPLDALASGSVDVLRREFAEPGRQWAAYLAGCLYLLHEQRYVNLREPATTGLSLAVYSTVPQGAGVSSSAAIEVATMMNLADHYSLRPDSAPWSADQESTGTGDRPAEASQSAIPDPRIYLEALRLAVLCQQVENRIVGAPCGVMDQVASCCGQAGALMRMICQPHELQPPLAVPAGVRFVGINSRVKHSVGGDPNVQTAGSPGQYGRTRCAAFMGHAIILDRMRRIGIAAGRELRGDPMGGYLANLDPDDYKKIFRPALPEAIEGREFLRKYGPTVDPATTVEPDHLYRVVQATDHHVLEARRVRQFAEFIEQAGQFPHGTRDQGALLDKAGHLMYASHLSYTNDALLGAPECNLLVKLVRDREPAGLYGAKITGGGSGGTVAVLAGVSAKADAAIADVMSEYERQTGRQPDLFAGTSPGAWHTGTSIL